MKFLSILLAAIFPILASAAGVQNKELPSSEMKKQNKEIVKLAAQEISKTLPQTVDEKTKLVGVKADDTTLVYMYEINISPKSDETVKKEDYSRMKEAVTYGTCNSSKRFLDADISIRYLYKSEHSKSELFKFDINKESCSKL
ncbi:MAG: hypothetical protein Q8N78_07720 [Sulfurimonas sp.]|nr:hypothetical protein [Sulfurimonas sp.]